MEKRHSSSKPRNSRLSVRIPKDVKDLIRETWDFKNFPLTAVSYPDKKDYRIRHFFASESEYLETICKIVSYLSKNKLAYANFINTILSEDFR